MARADKRFKLELDRFINHDVPVMITSYQRKLSLEFFKRVVERTPVDEGNARDSWAMSIGKPPSASQKDGNLLSKVINKLKSLRFGQITYIVNNAEYILILEDGGFVPKNPGPSSDPRSHRFGKVWVVDGYSVQAPVGMVKVTMEELESEFKF